MVRVTSKVLICLPSVVLPSQFSFQSLHCGVWVSLCLFTQGFVWNSDVGVNSNSVLRAFTMLTDVSSVSAQIGVSLGFCQFRYSIWASPPYFNFPISQTLFGSLGSLCPVFWLVSQSFSHGLAFCAGGKFCNTTAIFRQSSWIMVIREKRDKIIVIFLTLFEPLELLSWFLWTEGCFCCHYFVLVFPEDYALPCDQSNFMTGVSSGQGWNTKENEKKGDSPASSFSSKQRFFCPVFCLEKTQFSF